MLKITVPGYQEFWDEKNKEMIYVNEKDVTLRLEHSLIAISKWESKYCESFFETQNKTDEQVKYYIQCMTLNNDVDPKVYDRLTRNNIFEINNYLKAPMTATTVRDNQAGHKNSEYVTSELIYYWMIAYNIPVEFEKWPIQRLLMLIRVCSAKAEKPKKMSAREIMAQNKARNEARKARLHTRG
jgi:hypothetical protein